jgi:integrase
MPKYERFKTEYPGVTYIMGTHVVTGKPERVYYVRYRKDGVMVEEKAGRQFQNNMTPAKANNIRASRIDGKEQTNEERREAEVAKKAEEEGKWTFSRLWEAYKAQHPHEEYGPDKKKRPASRALRCDDGRYARHLKAILGEKTPDQLVTLDIDRIRVKMLKTYKAQSVKHVLGIIKRMVRFGVKKGLIEQPKFHIEMPRVQNLVTEDIGQDQLVRLLDVLDDESINWKARAAVRLALYTGMRRGELLRLEWEDIDFERGFIHIRQSKGGVPMAIPLNEAAREFFKTLPREDESLSSKVIPKAGTIGRGLRKIRKRANLPEDFRPLHGCRHAYASALASSGKVDLYVIQRLLTHKTPTMTQRYSHLRDEALKRAADVAGEIFQPSPERESKIRRMK